MQSHLPVFCGRHPALDILHIREVCTQKPHTPKPPPKSSMSQCVLLEDVPCGAIGCRKPNRCCQADIGCMYRVVYTYVYIHSQSRLPLLQYSLTWSVLYRWLCRRCNLLHQICHYGMLAVRDSSPLPSVSLHDADRDKDDCDHARRPHAVLQLLRSGEPQKQLRDRQRVQVVVGNPPSPTPRP